MTQQEDELMKTFKVDELEQRLEMKIWSGGGSSGCTWTSDATGITYADANCDGVPEFE